MLGRNLLVALLVTTDAAAQTYESRRPPLGPASLAGFAQTPASPGPAAAGDARLEGAWKAVTYQIAGTDYPMEGIFLFTRGHFAANVLFRFSGGSADDANANGGPYRADGRTIVFTQWVQLHLRPGDRKEPILTRRGVPESASYRIDGSRLAITFPSGNRYLLERLTE